MEHSNENTAKPLDPNEILSIEFNYIAQTAFQANEDRARVAQYYLVTTGTFLAALLTGQVRTSGAPDIQRGFGILFAMLGALGLIIVLQLIKLRLAWYDSVGAMNQIKDFYVAHINEPNLSRVFRWSTGTVPKRPKFWSITFLLTATVMLVSSVSLGIAIIFFGLAANGKLWWWIAIISGAVLALSELGIYWWALRE